MFVAPVEPARVRSYARPLSMRAAMRKPSSLFHAATAPSFVYRLGKLRRDKRGSADAPWPPRDEPDLMGCEVERLTARDMPELTLSRPWSTISTTSAGFAGSEAMLPEGSEAEARPQPDDACVSNRGHRSYRTHAASRRNICRGLLSSRRPTKRYGEVMFFAASSLCTELGCGLPMSTSMSDRLRCSPSWAAFRRSFPCRCILMPCTARRSRSPLIPPDSTRLG
jgi:hypothetical protein